MWLGRICRAGGSGGGWCEVRWWVVVEIELVYMRFL